MVNDKKFKSLKHESKGYDVFLQGGNAEKGYRPDYVLRRGDEYIILESESKHSVNLVFQLLSSGATFAEKKYVESEIV